ncbi:thiol-disulfide oxidoreductase DCC family protein [Rhodosalinus sp.]|uniref:thiol-disulfide oxidoreductase DCC family protein n=1 Tax=Rhodosalinus sp. TaxID=2047741 RepID=UPI00397B16B3
MADDDDIRVLYNGECPICSAEIGHYKGYAERKRLPIRFDDLNGPARRDWGMTEDRAARRLYVRKDGEVHGGIDGFLLLWRAMPRYRWLARIVGLPGLRPLAALTYDKVLAPLIYRWHLRRKARARARA